MVNQVPPPVGSSSIRGRCGSAPSFRASSLPRTCRSSLQPAYMPESGRPSRTYSARRIGRLERHAALQAPIVVVALLSVLLSLPAWGTISSWAVGGTSQGGTPTHVGPSAAFGLAMPGTSFPSCTVQPPGAGYSTYDAADQEVYATDTGSVILLTGNCHVVGYLALPKGASAGGIAYDPTNQKVYVADPALDKVYVISSTTVQHAISGLVHPTWLAYDPAIKGIAVADQGSLSGGHVWLVVDTKVRTTVNPHLVLIKNLAYSPEGSALAVLGDCRGCTGHAITVLNARTGVFLRSLHLGVLGGQLPFAEYSPLDRHVYVSDESQNTLDVVNMSDGTVVAQIPLGFDPTQDVYSAAGQAVYVVGGSQIAVVQDLKVVQTIEVTGGNGLFTAAYDSSNNDLYVSNGYGLTVFVVPT